MGSDGGCRAEPCFKSSVTICWERRWEFVRLGSAGQAFGEMSDPTCAGTAAYGITLSSLSYCRLFTCIIFSKVYSGKGHRKTPLEFVPTPRWFTFHPHHTHTAARRRTCGQENLPVEQPLPSALPCTEWIMRGERELVNHQVTRSTPPSVLFFL